MICQICGKESNSSFGYDCNCHKVAYKIFDYYTYEYIPHSGGCCPLVHVLNSGITQSEELVLEKLGWKKSSENYYWGPWINGLTDISCIFKGK